MHRNKTQFLFLNLGHFLDHLFMLIFAAAAALRLGSEWNMTYAELIPYATPGFIAFAVCSLIAGWIADKWSREGMIVIFFIGTGASSVLAAMSDTPVQIALSLTLIGVFAAIYHPVGIAMVVHGRMKTGVPLAINGVFGNLGVASAALLTGVLIDTSGWRSAFVVPGAVSIVLGMLYFWFIRGGPQDQTEYSRNFRTASKSTTASMPGKTMLRIFGVIFFTTAAGGLIFQSTTFSLPKVFDEQLAGFAGSATMVGWYAFLVFSIAALAQLFVGYLLDNYSIRPIFAVVALLQVAFFLAMTQTSGVGALITAIAFMLVVFGQIPINDVLVGRVVRSEWRSRAYALRYIVTFSVMAFTVPFIAWVHGTWGFSRLFGLLAVAASLIFAAVMFLPRTKHFVRQQPWSRA